MDEIGVMSREYYEADKKIKAQALGYDKQMSTATDDKVIIKNTTIDVTKEFSFDIGAATTEKAGVMTANDKSKLDNLANIGNSYDLNTYIYSGVYLINTSSNEAKNYPIQTPVNSVLRLTVTDSYDGNDHVIVQVLNVNNNIGGEGGIYIRSNQNQTWKPWAKLQTNVEVGLIDQTKMDDLTDNGIYSGILSTTGETFVIICINNYAIAQQVGVQHISHLKYSLVVGTGEIKIEKRTRDAYGFWTDWEDIGGGNSEVDITEAVRAQGLPYLVAQGLAKEGVTYVITNIYTNTHDFIQLDKNNKIISKITKKFGGADTEYIIYIKVINNSIIIESFASNGDGMDSGNSYLNYLKFIMDKSCTAVSLIAEATEL